MPISPPKPLVSSQMSSANTLSQFRIRRVMWTQQTRFYQLRKYIRRVMWMQMRTHRHKTHFEMCNCWSLRPGRKLQTCRTIMTMAMLVTTMTVLTLTSFFPSWPRWRFSQRRRRSERSSEEHNPSFDSVSTIEPADIKDRILLSLRFQFFFGFSL